MTAPVVLQAIALNKSFAGALFTTRGPKALDNVDFNMAEGDIWALAGPNGAGKSTLIRCLLGLLRADSGQISILSQPVESRAWRRDVGYLPDLFAPQPHLTVTEALTFYGRLSHMPEATLISAVPSMLARVELGHVGHKRVGTLSKGMNQRLGIAQSLLHSPKIVIWDEPTSGLDPSGRHMVIDLVQQMRAQGTTLLLATHILADIERACDHLAILVAGTLGVCDSMEALQAAHGHNSLEQLYLATVKAHSHAQ